VKLASVSFHSLDCQNILTVDATRDEISCIHPTEKDNVRTFTYDAVFGSTATQKAIYQRSAFPLVESVVEG